MGSLSRLTGPKSMQQQLSKGDRRIFAASDDSAMMKQILATHSPDGSDKDVKPILQIIKNILSHSTPDIESVLNGKLQNIETLEDKSSLEESEDMCDGLAPIIHKIGCEILHKCSSGGDAHTTTLALFNMLSSYSWDTKVVLTLAAFAVIYGEYSLITQLCTTNQLGKCIALLKQIPEPIELANSFKPQFKALVILVKAMMDVTGCIIDIKDLPSLYISPDTPAMSTALALIPAAVYWTARSAVACAALIASLVGLRHEYVSSASEVWELSSLAHKENNIYEHLRKELDLCYKHIDEKRHIDYFQTIERLFETHHLDNMKILKALICARDDIQPLVDGSTKTRVHLEVLRKKHVLLLISDLDLTQEEIMILDIHYRDAQTRPGVDYEVVWIPIPNGSGQTGEPTEQRFLQLQSRMPWYSVHHPSLIEPAVIKYIKEKWRFMKKAILVASDPQGKVSSTNALHMIYIWGNVAFPFTTEKEEDLWKAENWRLELLVDAIDPAILDWIGGGKIICLYGGEDLEWIQKFIAMAKSVAAAANIPLEMLYVGKNNSKERVRKNSAIITKEKLSHCWPEPTTVWFFWARLESMMYSKLQHGKTVENDPIMQEVMTMLSFDGSDSGWAIFCRGSIEMARAKGDTVLDSLTSFDKWQEDANQKGFILALAEYLQKLHTPHHCNRLILPGIDGSIPERVVCAECGRPMEKYFMYRCCVD